MSDAEEMLGLAEDGVKRALARGATSAEVYVTRTESTTISVVGGYAIPKEASDTGIAVRVTVGPRLGLSGASGMSPAGLDGLVERALEAARRVPESTRFEGFRAPPDASRGPTPLPAPSSGADLAALVGAVSERFRAAQDVTYSGVTAHTWRSRFAVASSTGARAWDQGGGEYLTMEARAGPVSATDSLWSRAALAEAHDAAGVADALVARARSARSPRKLDAPVPEAILAPGPVSQLVALFAPALSGRRVAAKQTPLADKLGQRVLSEALRLSDEPHGPHGVFHHRVDHEGSPTRPLPLVERGTIASFLGVGNGWRGGVTGGVGVRALNLQMAPGEGTLADLVAGAKRAVLVNEALMGGFAGNEVTGDFSLVAPFAFLVEDGEIRHALPPTTVGGNVHRVLAEIRALGADRRTYASGTYPSMRAGGLSCAT